MALQAKQTIQQRLMLAPNVTMALEILRMPMLELQAFLEHQLEENPLLELEESTDQETESPSAESDDRQEPPTNGLSEDWMSHWRTAGEREEPNDESPEDTIPDHGGLALVSSLHESLRLQLGCLPLSEEEQRLGELLIQHLDEYGYLDDSLEELASEAGAGLEHMEAALRLIQRFDPPGVGARDLRECLMLQLEQRQQEGSLAYQILKDHFKLFTERRLAALAKATGATIEQVSPAFEELKRLNPRPGRIFASDLPPCVVPDLIIRQREKHYDVELNDQEVPQLRVSRTYYRMLKDPRTPSDAKEFLTNKFRQAGWLMKAIDERNTTLLSIARCLISLQRDFLEQGPRAIKPLTQAQVASLIGRHPSTVSRAIAGKTLDTPYGVFRLEQLFASSVPQSDEASEISDEKIKSEVQRLIIEENPQHPLSDSALTQRLAQRHITVARRTIAKYRTSLKILPAHLRKRRL